MGRLPSTRQWALPLDPSSALPPLRPGTKGLPPSVLPPGEAVSASFTGSVSAQLRLSAGSGYGIRLRGLPVKTPGADPAFLP